MQPFGCACPPLIKPDGAYVTIAVLISSLVLAEGTMRRLILLLCLLGILTTIAAGQQYDLVIEGGRVIDPETGLDAVRNVGIRDGKVVRVSTEVLSGRRVVHAGGLGVAPGFIDLHQHGQDM